MRNMVNILKDEEFTTMKRLHITKEQFEKSKYFTKKYGTLKFVSESGRLFKTDKGQVLRFDEGMIGDSVPMMAAESQKLVKEGAGAGYTVTLKEVKLTNAKVINRTEDGDWEFEADIVKDEYQVQAEDYYNRFCPSDDWGVEYAEVVGKVYGVCWWYEDERDVERQINGQEQDIGFDYGGGWTHADLPKDGHITADRIRADEHDTWAIQSIELDAPMLSEVVNDCHEDFFNRDDEEEVDESKQVVKESASELSKFAEELDGLFGKKVLARVNSTGTECTVDTPPALDKEVQHFIQSACDANGWECKRIVRNLILTYRIKCGEETV